MGKLDPRSKICFSITICTVSFIFREIFWLLGLYWLAVVVCVASGAELFKMFKKTRWITRFIFLIALGHIFLKEGGEVYFEYEPYFIITEVGCIDGLEFFLQCNMLLMLMFFIGTSSQRSIMQSLVAVKVPYELAYFVTFPGRFMPILNKEYNNSLHIMSMRGVDIKNLSLLQKINMYTYLWSSVTSNSFLKTREMSISMETRGFRLIDEKENIYRNDLTFADYFVIFWSIMAFSATILFKVLENVPIEIILQ